MNKKIITFTDLKFPNSKANAIQRFQMVEAFQNLGYNSVIFIKTGYHENLKKNLGLSINPKVWSSNSNIYIIHLLKFLIYLIRSSPRETIVYTRDILASFLIILLGFQVALEFHSANLSWKQRLVLKLISNSNNVQFISISQGLKTALKGSVLSKSSKNIVVLHDGVLDWKIQENTTKSTKDICYIGSFYEGRGIELIMEIAEARPEVEFHFYGNSKNNLNLPPNVYLNGPIDNVEVISILSQFKIALMPYQKNTTTSNGDITTDWMSPLKMFEYMASSACIISSDLPVLREVLNEDNSILADPDSILEWIDGISYLLDNEKKRKKLVSNANLDVLNYTLGKRALSILKLFNEK